MSRGKRQTGIFAAIDRSRQVSEAKFSDLDKAMREELEELVLDFHKKKQAEILEQLRVASKDPTQKLMHSYRWEYVDRSFDTDPFAFRKILFDSSVKLDERYPAAILAYKAEALSWLGNELQVEVAKKLINKAIAWQKAHIKYLQNAFKTHPIRHDAWRFYGLYASQRYGRHSGPREPVIEWAKEELKLYEKYKFQLDVYGELRDRTYDRMMQNGQQELNGLINNKVGQLIIAGNQTTATALIGAESKRRKDDNYEIKDEEIVRRVIETKKYLSQVQSPGKEFQMPSIQYCTEEELYRLKKELVCGEDPALLTELANKAYVHPSLDYALPVVKSIEEVIKSVKAMRRAPDYYNDHRGGWNWPHLYKQEIYTVIAAPELMLEFLDYFPKAQMGLVLEQGYIYNTTGRSYRGYKFGGQVALEMEDAKGDKVIIQLTSDYFGAANRKIEEKAIEDVMKTEALKELWRRANDPATDQVRISRKKDTRPGWSEFTTPFKVNIKRQAGAKVNSEPAGFETTQKMEVQSFEDVLGVDDCSHKNTIWYPTFEDASICRNNGVFKLGRVWNKCCKDCYQPRLAAAFRHQLPEIEGISFNYNSSAQNHNASYLELINRVRIAEGKIKTPYPDIDSIKKVEPVIDIKDSAMPTADDIQQNKKFFEC